MTIRKPAFLLEGHLSYDETDEWIQPWRLPFDQMELFTTPNDTLVTRASKTSGVRLRFATDATSATLRGQISTELAEDNRSVDLTQGGQILSSVPWKPDRDSVELLLAGNSDELYELWLPTFADVRVESLTLTDATRFEKPHNSQLRWLTYGSSITHCRGATSPARSWPAVAARKHDLHLTNMGYGGQCHVDGTVARVIRDLDVDIVTLKLGINVYADASLSERSFRPAVINLIETIREKQPRIPIGVIGPIWSGERERAPNSVGMTLEDYREMDREVVELLRSRGDERLRYFDGRNLLGQTDEEVLPDGLHPSGEGYELMGRRAAEAILPPLLGLVAQPR
jgi:lysophospholipase L1-like esterase